MRIQSIFQNKFLIALIAISLISIVLPTPQTLAKTDQQVKVSSATGRPGEQVQIDFTMDDGVGVAGMQFVVNYDKEQFLINDNYSEGIIQPEGLNLGSPTVGIFNKEGYMNVVLLRGGVTPISSGSAGKKVHLLGVKFTIKPNAVNGTYPITITKLKAVNGDATEEPIGTPINGSITIKGGASDKDKTLPVIKITGDETVNIPIGTTYKDAGATAKDMKGGDITKSIVTTITNDVDDGTTFDNTKAATYTFHYKVKDAANKTNEVTRTVVVGEPESENSTSLKNQENSKEEDPSLSPEQLTQKPSKTALPFLIVAFLGLMVVLGIFLKKRQ